MQCINHYLRLLSVQAGICTVWLLCCSPAAYTQSKFYLEQYNYIRQSAQGTFQPIIRFETKNNWHFETRYNYEDVQTGSCFAGKTFGGGSRFAWTITPLAGVSAGRFTGASVALNTELSWNKLYYWAQSQYSMAIRDGTASFFFNWSELGYAISSHVYAGPALQYTLQKGSKAVEPGMVAGMNFKNISFPLYLFNPFSRNHYMIVGLNYEFTLKKSVKTF